MGFIINLSLRSKFILIGIMTFLITLTIVGFQISSQRSAYEHVTKDIVGVGSKSKILALEISANINYTSRLTRNIMLGSDYGKDMEKLIETKQKIEKAFEELSEIPAPSESFQSEVQAAKTSTMEFINVSIDIISRAESMAPEERSTLYEQYHKEATPLANQSRDTFKVILENTDKMFNESIDGFFSDVTSGQRVELFVSLFLVFLQLGILFVFYRFTAMPLENISHVMRTLSHGEGDLSARMPIIDKHKEHDVINKLSVNFNNYLDNIDKQFTGTMYLVGDASEHTMPVSTALIKVKDSIEHNNALATQVAAAGEEMSATISEIASAAADSADKAEQTVILAKEGGDAINSAKSSALMVGEIISALETEVANLTGKATQIGSVISVINDISEQTNLLALNAAIEAARAGEAGRGFAVVADEVRKLAEKTQNSTKEIESMVRSMTDNIAKVSGGAHDVVTALSKQQGATEEAYSSFQTILVSIEDLNSLITNISTSVAQQSATTQEIMGSITGVAESSEHSLEIMLQLAQNTDGLIDTITRISEKYSKFVLTSKGFHFAVAKIAHVNLMKNVFDCYSKGQCNFKLPDHTSCRFGQFYYGLGKELFGNDSDFRALEEPHKSVHKISHEIFDSMKSGRHGDMSARFDQLDTAVQNFLVIIDRLMKKYA